MKSGKIKKIIPIILILILLLIGTYLFLNYKNKEYNLTEVLECNYYKLNENNKYGVIDIKGNVVIEPVYDNVQIPNPEKAVFICEKDDKVIVLNEKNEKIFTQYDEVTAISIQGILSNVPYEKTVLRYKLNEKYGLIDFTGKVITKPIYEEIKGLQNKESELLVKKDNKYGVINAKGAKLINEEYYDILADGYYTEENQYALSGYIVSNKTNDGYRYGYISSKLKKVLDVEYNYIARVLETDNTKDIYLIATKNGQTGVIKNNKVIINLDYQGIEYESNNKVFELQRNFKFGVADLNGKVIIPVEYTSIELQGVYLKVIKNEEEPPKYFSVDGTEITDAKYTSKIKTKHENYYIVINEEGLYGVIDNNGKELIPLKYNYLEYVYEDIFIASDELLLGIINVRDETVIDFKYEVIQKIEDTNIIEAKIYSKNKLDLYNKELKNMYSTTNNSYVYKNENYIKVSAQNETKYFNLDGNELKVEEIYINNLLFASNKNNKWGFVDKEQNVIVDYKYDRVTEFNNYGYAGINLNGKWGIIDKNGNVLVEPTYVIQEINLEPEFLGKYYKIYYGYGEAYYTNQVNE